MSRETILAKISEYSKRQSETRRDTATYWKLEDMLNMLRWALLDNPA